MKIDDIINYAITEKIEEEEHSPYGLLLFSLVANIKAKNVLEIGVRNGGSTFPILEALKYTNGILTSVDIVENKVLREKLIDSTNWNYIINDSLKFLETLSNVVIYDFIFIDGWHSYDHVKKELNLIQKHITPSTIIVIHDTMAPSTQPNYHIYKNMTGEWAGGGPTKVLFELDKNEWEFATIPIWHGLTILRKLGKVLEF